MVTRLSMSNACLRLVRVSISIVDLSSRTGLVEMSMLLDSVLSVSGMYRVVVFLARV